MLNDRLTLRLDAADLAALDAFIAEQPWRITRSEAARRLLKTALTTPGGSTSTKRRRAKKGTKR
jgi:hypothetical protein